MTFDERLAALQTLFVQRAEIDAKLRELLDGAEPSLETEKPKRKYQRKEAEPKIVGRSFVKKARQTYSSDRAAEMVRDHDAGMKMAEMVRKYNLASPSIYNYMKKWRKNNAKTTKHNTVMDYICVDGHEFKSKLAPGDVMCPICHSTDCDLGTLNGPVVE